MIDKTLIHFKTKAEFDRQLAAGNILPISIVFIEDHKAIWSHGQFYSVFENTITYETGYKYDLHAGDNVEVTWSSTEGIVIKAKNTTYTLQVEEGKLVLTDDKGVKSSVTLPEATATTVGGIKVDTKKRSESLIIGDKTIQLVPSGGLDGQVLLSYKNKAYWGYNDDRRDLIVAGSWDAYGKNPNITVFGGGLNPWTRMKGCVYNPKEKKVVYWLDTQNWWKKEYGLGDNARMVMIRPYQGSNTVCELQFSENHQFGVGQYLHFVNGNYTYSGVVMVKEILGQDHVTATLVKGKFVEEVYTVEFGSNLTGYDGEVMVQVPEFWYKSETKDNKRTVMYSIYPINPSWVHQPEVFVGAYRDTILNTVPENMGYLSTLPQGAAVCVKNDSSYCIGGTGVQGAHADNIAGNALGKCRTNMTRSEFREAARKSGKEIMSYEQYKSILYWPHVLESESLNSQKRYRGVTDVPNHTVYNQGASVVPNGYTDSLGNGTGEVSLVIPKVESGGQVLAPATTTKVYRWQGIECPFGDVWQCLDGVSVNYYPHLSIKYVSNPKLYGDNIYTEGGLTGSFDGATESGYNSDWEIDTRAELCSIVSHNYTIQDIPEDSFDYVNVDGISLDDANQLFLVGGTASMENKAGLGCMTWSYRVTEKRPDIGFRTVVFT